MSVETQNVEGVTVFDGSGQSSFVPCIPGKTSDGYHTIDELYNHRCLLFAAFMREYATGMFCKERCWRSHQHHDGSQWGGWFVAGMDLPTGTITYHLPARMWDLLKGIPVRERAPEWDGHTPADVLQRLEAWLRA